MMSVRKLGQVGLVALMLSAGSVLAYDQEQFPREPNGSEEFVDALYGRPLGLFAIALGAVTFVLSLPFSLPSHSSDSAAKGLVVDPVNWTFKRPLGRFISCDEQPDFCK